MTIGDEATLMEHLIGTVPGREGVAIILGWDVLHLRPAKTSHGWRTPVQGSLGKGWPDLILVKGARMIAAEVKSAKGRVADEQRHVLELLGRAGAETYIWRPDDWDSIVATLQGRRERVETTTVGEAMRGERSFLDVPVTEER